MKLEAKYLVPLILNFAETYLSEKDYELLKNQFRVEKLT